MLNNIIIHLNISLFAHHTSMYLQSTGAINQLINYGAPCLGFILNWGRADDVGY